MAGKIQLENVTKQLKLMITSYQCPSVVAGATAVILVQFSLGAPSFDHSFKGPITRSIFSPPALAGPPPKARPKFRYNPPNRGAPRSTQATISRGCTQSASAQSNSATPAPLTLLAPNDHDGLTTSGHPTFFWHISTPVSMVFALTEPGVAQPILEQQIQPQQAGVVQLKMPKDSPELSPGREYRWSVTLICNPDRPSANPFIQSWIKRIPAKPELTQQLAAATSDHERALIYAETGFWYDALEAISTAQTANPVDPSILEDRLTLLDQAGLRQVVAQERQ